jgi:hypothetical protein
MAQRRLTKQFTLTKNQFGVMSNYRSTRYAKVRAAHRRQGISAYYQRKAASELIPENEHVFRPKISPDAVVIVKLKGHPQMQFSSYRTPWGGWSISPTLAGAKVQQTMIGYSAAP